MPVFVKGPKWVYKGIFAKISCFRYRSPYICLNVISNISKIMIEFRCSSSKRNMHWFLS